jgi:hypothetical protein
MEIQFYVYTYRTANEYYAFSPDMNVQHKIDDIIVQNSGALARVFLDDVKKFRLVSGVSWYNARMMTKKKLSDLGIDPQNLISEQQIKYCIGG